jgi:hypothetical protein
MSQNDFNIANQGFPSFRSDLNSALQALASTSSGATAPATPYANQLWYDTSTGLLKIRNEANSAWINLFGVSTDGFVIEDKIIHTGDTDTSVRFPAADTVTVETAGAERLRVTSTGNVGIGTTSPTQLLDVSGTANATNLTRGGSQVYSRNNILGTVTQSGGVPTGAIIERGSNANGEFIKYADGTLILVSPLLTLTLSTSTFITTDWTLPTQRIINVGGGYLVHTATPNSYRLAGRLATNAALSLAMTWMPPDNTTTQVVRLYQEAASNPFASGNSVDVYAVVIGRWF